MPKKVFGSSDWHGTKSCQEVFLMVKGVRTLSGSAPSLVLFSSGEAVLMNCQYSIVAVVQPVYKGDLAKSQIFLQLSLS